MTPNELKERLLKLKENKYETTYDEVKLLLPTMLKNIGNTDMVLRDHLIYVAFYFWIVRDHLIPNDQLKEWHKLILSDEYLMKSIGQTNDKSVYTRTFSVLLLALILHSHASNPFLTHEEVLNIKEKLVEYYLNEKDYSAYSLEFGWAHGVAHAADAIDELVGCSECDLKMIYELLNAIKAVIHNDSSIFNHGEDERIAQIFITVIKQNKMSTNQLMDWFATLKPEQKQGEQRPLHRYQYYVKLTNTKSLLKSTYFLFKQENMHENVLERLYEIICELGKH